MVPVQRQEDNCQERVPSFCLQGIELRSCMCTITTFLTGPSPSLICPLLPWLVAIFLPSSGCHLTRLRSKGREVGRLLRATSRQQSQTENRGPSLLSSPHLLHLYSPTVTSPLHPAEVCLSYKCLLQCSCNPCFGVAGWSPG